MKNSLKTITAVSTGLTVGFGALMYGCKPDEKVRDTYHLAPSPPDYMKCINIPDVAYTPELEQRLNEAQTRYVGDIEICVIFASKDTVTEISMRPLRQGVGDSYMSEWADYIALGGTKPTPKTHGTINTSY